MVFDDLIFNYNITCCRQKKYSFSVNTMICILTEYLNDLQLFN